MKQSVKIALICAGLTLLIVISDMIWRTAAERKMASRRAQSAVQTEIITEAETIPETER